MKFEKIHNKGQARIFQSQYLEMLTKTHPLVIWGIYIPIIIYLCCFAAMQSWIIPLFYMVLVLPVGGMLFWTLFEYIMHRFIFHFIAESPRAQRFIYVQMHGNHHEYPRDKERLFMPPVPSLIIASVLFALEYLAIGGGRFYVLPRLYIRLPDVWHHALCHSCLEPAI